MLIQNITLDFTKEYTAGIAVQQYETDGRGFELKITSNGTLPINLTGASVTLYATKPDNNTVYEACTVLDGAAGKALFVMPSSMCDVDGSLACVILVSKDGKTLRSPGFEITVNESPDISGAAASTSQWTSLEEALADVAEVKARISTAEAEISDHETRITQNKDGILNIPNKNYCINGIFQINQRAVSGTVVLSEGQYGHDRFKAGTNGCTYTFATSGNVTTITILSGSLKQVIEGSSLLSGNHTLSWSGTCQGRINGGSYGTSPRSASLTGGINAEVEFSTGTLSKVKLETGSVATPFAPNAIAEELRDCQRYCWQGSVPTSSGNVYYGVATSNGLQFIFGFSLPVTMRANPTVTIITPPTYQNCSFGGWAADANGVCMRGDITAVGAYRAFGGVYRADAEL